MHVIDYLQMTQDSDTATDTAEPPYAGAAGDSCTARDCRVGTNAHIVGNLYLVIQYHPVLENGIFQSASIDGCSC